VRVSLLGEDRQPEVGEGRLTTAPLGETDAPDAFAFAIGSCHQPFDDQGQLRPASLQLLQGLTRALEEHGVEGLLLLGDQMYTDLPDGQCLWDDVVFARFAPPGRRRLLDCTRAEVRALFQQRYRAFWKVDTFRALQAARSARTPRGSGSSSRCESPAGPQTRTRPTQS
jgi:alkaline phosphatase D